MALVYLDTQTASSSSNLSFTSGITSSYNAYEFHFIDMHPANDSEYFGFQVNAYDPSAGTPQLTGFNETMTTTMFRAINKESGSTPTVQYQGGGFPYDQAQGNSYQSMAWWVGKDNDQSASGILTLYAPSSTTYVKHFTSRTTYSQASDYVFDAFVAGYINTPLAITQIDFKFNSGNIDAGKIHMYGVT